MTNELTPQIDEPPKGQFLLYQAEDGELKIDVRFENESVWLSKSIWWSCFKRHSRTLASNL